ncbi:MAG TPA: helix-turn-helix transcriptional regulator [Steroidobacteraceae bacterium]|jgi:DNA-binding transcriptional ArsR family regulator|nr:helix-turn-helix transcriptional regulator [Steroidobacteraceae bacterium]
MDVEPFDVQISGIAATIGEPARARMLYCLLDGHARTSTELGIVAEVSPSTASVHLARLKDHQLVKVLAQGKHRYYSLKDADVAQALEALSVVAGSNLPRFVPNTPDRLRTARTCYDHMAGEVAVALHDRLWTLGWLRDAAPDRNLYELTEAGVEGLSSLGIDPDLLLAMRRRFAYACLDWSERKPHIGGALGSALLKLALRKKWVTQDFNGRGLGLTQIGRREMALLKMSPSASR